MLPTDDAEQRIPIYEERAHIARSEVVTDRVQVSTVVEERPVLIEDVIERGGLAIERVAVDRVVTAAPEPRHEGDTLIVSVVEERLVVEKRLFVIEEVRITRTATHERVSMPETVRTMRATIERASSQPTGRETDG